MKSWNFRVVDFSNSNSEPMFGICEVYYDDDQDQEVVGQTNPVPVVESTIEELRSTLMRMLDALDKPVVPEYNESEK